MNETNYEVELVSNYKAQHKEVYELEQMLHKDANAYHYKPSTSFAGSSRECFTKNVLEVPEVKYIFDL